jgi:hypothetical protein
MKKPTRNANSSTAPTPHKSDPWVEAMMQPISPEEWKEAREARDKELAERYGSKTLVVWPVDD